jgi:O-antigen ligase
MSEVVQRATRAAPPVAVEGVALVLASTVPALLAYNLPPSSTMLNQCIAVGLWAGVVAVGARTLSWRPSRALQAAAVALLIGLLMAGALGGLPGTLVLGMAAVVLAAGLVAAHAAASARRNDEAGDAFVPCAVGLAAAAAISMLVALIQAFAPDWADGDFIARSGLPGRAVGNLRQPNHLCSLLLWGVIAVVALLEMRRLALKWAVALVVLMVFAVELSASRTGALGLGLLALWGALDKRLSRPARALLVLTPAIYALSYGGMALYGQWTDQAFGAEARIATGEATGESPNSRKRIWANTLTLVAQQPWTGVGFGEFNFAWSLTAFPGRPTAFFDHTHNLPLQLAVELGLPLSMLVLALLGAALWQAWKRSGEASGNAGTAARAAFMLVLMIGLHSLFEYPLWYAYFLLPTAFAWGFALGCGVERSPLHSSSTAASDTAAVPRAAPLTDAATATTMSRNATPTWPLHASRILGLLLVAGSVYAVFDYLRIASIYSPGTNAAPLNERIATGQRSVLFGHHADYAAATSTDPLPGRDLAFRRAPHHLLDTRLMMSWAEYLAETGELEKARWLAQRLREFRNPASDEFFAACDLANVDAPADRGAGLGPGSGAVARAGADAAASAGGVPNAGADAPRGARAAAQPQPFQCQPPQTRFGWREFVQR